MSRSGDSADVGDRDPVTDFEVQPDVGALYLKHRRAMHASARKVLAPHAMQSDAEDAVAIVIKRLLEAHGRGELERKDDWERYLRWAARNEALKIVKARGRVASLDEHLEDFDNTDTIYERTLASILRADPNSIFVAT